MKKVSLFGIALGICVAHASALAATIQQTVQFDGTTPERLYALYLSSSETSAFTEAPATIDPVEGGSYSAYGGHITGKLLQLVPGRLIVQSWRGKGFNASALDTTLVLTFQKNETGAEIDMVQANVPDETYGNTNTSWNLNYWGLIRDYLRAHP